MIKKLLFSTSVLLSLAAVNAFGQQNGGFETWGSTAGEPEGPTNWVTGNILSHLLTGNNPQSAFKVQDKTEGTYALKLVTVALKDNKLKGQLPDTVGFAINGSVTISSTVGFKDRDAFTGRPLQLDFFTKYIPTADDTAYAVVHLSRWNATSNTRETVAGGLLRWPATANYTAKTVMLLYVSSATPDSVSIMFSSSKAVRPKTGSQLFLDDVKFTGTASIKDKEALAAKVSIYPNPAAEFVTIAADINTADRVVIYNQIGKQIGIYNLNNKMVQLKTAGFASGNYYYSILEKSGNVLVGGVFSVVK